jgi:hypothetical protein
MPLPQQRQPSEWRFTVQKPENSFVHTADSLSFQSLALSPVAKRFSVIWIRHGLGWIANSNVLNRQQKEQQVWRTSALHCIHSVNSSMSIEVAEGDQRPD